jgi:DnaJ-class molecular chaperone
MKNVRVMRYRDRKVRVMRQSECAECYGTGVLEIETPVADWNHGGYIKSRIVECYDCDGTGLNEVEPEEEE